MEKKVCQRTSSNFFLVCFAMSIPKSNYMTFHQYIHVTLMLGKMGEHPRCGFWLYCTV